MKDFKHIDNVYRPIPFWSWNDKLDVCETVGQIDEMAEQGIGGVFMHARNGLKTEYMGNEWFKNVGASINKCKEKGMRPWVYDEHGWPSGFGAGVVNGKGIEYQQKYLRFEKGEKHTKTTIVNCDGYHFWYEVNPYYVDTLDAKVIKEFIDNIYQPYYDRFGDSFEGFFTDEPQISRNGMPWSLTLPEEYKKAYGEELLPNLIQLFKEVGDYKITRIKYWKLVTEMFSTSYMKQIYDWCSKHDLKLTGHLVLEESLYVQISANGACMPHYEYMSIPGMDWLGRDVFGSLTPYQVGSVARQLGKKQVISESFAMCGHNVGHDELKRIYEYQMVRGINLLCQHLQGYSNRGLRKRDYPPAMYIQQPWWKNYRIFNDAMSRIGMLLADGDDCVDTLVIHPQTTAWTIYNDSEFYVPDNKSALNRINDLNRKFMDVLAALERKHVNFHLGDEIILERHGRVVGKELVIGKKKYSRIIMSVGDELLDNTKRLIDVFVKNGGEIVTVDDIKRNNIINIPEITYCQRKYEDHTIHYFVNSTENTYDAFIEKGNKIMDPVTGELSSFDGHYTFRKYESLVVIDDYSGRKDCPGKKVLQPVPLDGEWSVKNFSDNILTLDYCDYYFDGVLEEKNGYILNAMYRALNLKKPVRIRCDFSFKAKYIPDELYLVCETPECFNISINGSVINKADRGYLFDKSFRKINIAENTVIGNNVISMEIMFAQSEAVYQNIEKSRESECERNKLTFDMELEQIYLSGQFSVDTVGCFKDSKGDSAIFSGEFAINEPRKKVTLTNIERQGFPFFAGEITLKNSFITRETEMQLDFTKKGINVVKAKINGNELPPVMWEPYCTDISEFVRKGNNEIELTLINNLRNMQGPLHLTEEHHRVAPSAFYKEVCVWKKGNKHYKWNDGYCFVNVSLEKEVYEN